MSSRLTTILGQPSWSIKSDLIEAHLTQLGGHLGPLRIKLGRKTVEPLSVAPWAEEKLDKAIPPILRSLRGDFFCCPFGENGEIWRRETHPVHGESANKPWTLKSIEREGNTTRLLATLNTTIRRGKIEKIVALTDGQTVVYQRHLISRGRGPIPVGHHAMVKFPDTPGSGLFSVSNFVRAQVYPGQFENPAQGGQQSLKPGAIFRSLERVPMLKRGQADLSRYLARRGFEDLVMLTSDPSLPFAWSAVVFPKQGYVWFALKNPRVLRHTVVWISNGGRQYAPWSGRHVNVMGIEETSSYFHEGLASSARRNDVSRAGYPTTLSLTPTTPTSIDYIMGVAEIPNRFDHVADVLPTLSGIELRSRTDKRARCDLNLGWIAD